MLQVILLWMKKVNIKFMAVQQPVDMRYLVQILKSDGKSFPFLLRVMVLQQVKGKIII